MELINYDDLYEDAVVDFSNHMGIKPFKLYENPQEKVEDVEEPEILSEVVYQQYPEQEVKKEGVSVKDKETPKQNYSKFNGFEQFNRIYDKVQAYNPDAARFRSLLTKIASIESSFRPSVVNGIGAAGYFQFIDSTRINIMKKIGKSSNKSYFLNNPEVQILAAIQLAKDFEKSFSKDDLQKAYKKGHTMNGLISGAWLGGAGSVKKYLKTGKDSSDGGTTVSKRIKIGDLV